MRLRTLDKRNSTNEDGIFFKEIVDDKDKVVDKIFLIRYRVDEKDKLITVGKYSQGIRVNYCKTKRNEILNNIRLGETPTTIKAKRVSKDIILFETIANDYFEHIKMHNKDFKNTISRYNLHIKSYIGDKNIETITINDIEQIQRDKLKLLSPKTVNHIVQIIGTIYNFAIDRDKFKGLSPIKRIKKIKFDNVRERFLSVEEIGKIVSIVQDDEQLLLFLKLALCTGARLETLLQIKKKDINLESQMVTLTDFKNNSTYKGFITSELMEMIKNRLEQLGINDFLLNYHNTKDLKSKFSKIYKPILDELFNKGLDKMDSKNRVVIHTFRHTFASHLAINGTPIYTIQKLMNHKDITMTMRYAKLAPDSGKKFVNELYK